MKKITHLHFKALLAFLFICNSADAQFVTPDVFIQGNSLEIGIGPVGCYGSQNTRPTGYHARLSGGSATSPPTTSRMGFVSDPGLDGWDVGTPNFIGDYFVPGSPHEGWDVQIDGNWNTAWGTTGTFASGPGSTGTLLLTGANTGMSVVGREKIGVWEGTMGALAITQKTILDTTRTFFLIEVKLKNTGATDLLNIYYERTVDPDNEQTITGSFNTNNTIVFQPGEGLPESGDKCLVTSIGTTYPAYSYLGLGTIDCRAKSYVLSGGLTPSNKLDAIHAGTAAGGFSGANVVLGYNSSADVGIGLVFNIGTIAAGDSTIVKYAYILRAEDLDTAFASLGATLEIDDFGYGTGDTLEACVGDTVDVAVIGGNSYIWDTWIPETGLLLPPGRTNRIVVTEDTVTYLIIGTSPICDNVDTITITVRPLVLLNPGVDSTVQMCGNVPPMNLITLLGGEPQSGGIWTGPGVSASGMFSPGGLAEGVYYFNYTHAIGACDTASMLTIMIVNDVDLDFDFTPMLGCESDSVQFTNLTDSLIYYRWNFGDGSPHDTATFSPFHIYEDQGDYGVWLVGINERGCIDSLLKIVSLVHPLEASFIQSKDSVCQSVNNSIAFFNESVGSINTYSWDFGDGNTSDLEDPIHFYTAAGSFITRLIVTDDIGCSDTAFNIVYVDTTPSLSLSFDKDEICSGDQIRVNAHYTATAKDLIWNFGDGSVVRNLEPSFTHSYPTPGQYIITVTSEHPVCPDSTVFDTVFVKQYPQINLGADDAICLRGAPIMLDPTMMVTNPPGTIYYWNTGDSMAVLKITEPGVYRVYANLDGCITTDEIEINKDCYTDVPNSFTPNGDGANDYFYPRQLLSEGIVDFKMVIYNRWGELIFETNNPEGRGWDGKFDGKDQPMGVYVYQMSVRYKNQTAEKYSGNVTLLR